MSGKEGLPAEETSISSNGVMGGNHVVRRNTIIAHADSGVYVGTTVANLVLYGSVRFFREIAPNKFTEEKYRQWQSV